MSYCVTDGDEPAKAPEAKKKRVLIGSMFCVRFSGFLLTLQKEQVHCLEVCAVTMHLLAVESLLERDPRSPLTSLLLLTHMDLACYCHVFDCHVVLTSRLQLLDRDGGTAKRWTRCADFFSCDHCSGRKSRIASTV